MRTTDGIANKLSFTSMTCRCLEPVNKKVEARVNTALRNARPVMTKIRMLRQFMPMGGVFQRITDAVTKDMTTGATASGRSAH
jgi:hypothetical protein